MSNFLRTGKKIVAIGRNYKAHAAELGNKVPPEPFFFLKPTTSYLENGGKVELLRGSVVHHEVELGVVIGNGGRDIPASKAMDHVAGYALSIDLTARNIQDHVKSLGLPWSTAKGFDTANPTGSFIPASSVSDPHNLRLWLDVNGVRKQDGATFDMVNRIPELIEHVSSIMSLEEGDLLLTGTPSGVGPISPSDTMTAGIIDIESGKPVGEELKVSVAEREGGYVFKGKK